MSLVQAVAKHYNAIAAFPYGSAVYLNKTPDDYDFIIVTDSNFQEQIVIDGFDCEVSSYSKEEFLKKLQLHDISLLECLLIEHSDFVNRIPETNDFQVDLSLLREAISQKSSNSYVKAKKKLIVEEDFDLKVSFKSLWHSLRIADFGLQVATLGKITNPQSVNQYYPEIVQDYFDSNNDWATIHQKYKPIEPFQRKMS